jgi:hypothetical protein
MVSRPESQYPKGTLGAANLNEPSYNRIVQITMIHSVHERNKSIRGTRCGRVQGRSQKAERAHRREKALLNLCGVDMLVNGQTQGPRDGEMSKEGKRWSPKTKPRRFIYRELVDVRGRQEDILLLLLLLLLLPLLILDDVPWFAVDVHMMDV